MATNGFQRTGNAFQATGFAFQQFVEESASGGWWIDYDYLRRQRAKRKRELEELEREQEAIQDARDREIAALLRAQEIKDAERADLERLQRLADRYAGQKLDDLPKVARVAILNAQDQRTRNSLEQMQRVIEQSLEDEMIAVQQIVLLMLDG